MNQGNYEHSIAVIGLSGYFPQSRNVEEFWQWLIRGKECISHFTDEELIADGEDPQLLNNPDYVRAKGTITEPEYFDASFFGISPAEAALIDPQHRLFLECCWHAIEDSGCNLDAAGAVGVFGSAGMSTYLLHHLTQNPSLLREYDSYQLMLGNDKDYIATRVSFKLNLSGPSISVQTACSSSLVAVHLACQSLLNGECDMALAGGASVSFPHSRGYLYQKGMIFSPDGHCRPFDKHAAGTVEGNGAGVVLLKRLEDAIADNDRICAVIRGSAINNDGAEKIGYTAPSVVRQTEVISEALDIAGVDAGHISYVETHGTGTPLGDPIEIAALTNAFRQHTDKIRYCALGSLKSNLGHLNSAAGVAGLIKVVLSLKNKYIPASLNYSTPNPNIDFDNSPFYVNSCSTPWTSSKDTRCAAVSSFGIGGTNAHIVLSEAPSSINTIPSLRQSHILTISAKTKNSVVRYCNDLQHFLQKNRDLALEDIAFTMQTGRQEFEYRRAIVGNTIDEVITKLADTVDNVGSIEHKNRMVWMFSGQGSQHIGMAREVYSSEPFFHNEFDRCCALLEPHLAGKDIRQAIFSSAGNTELASAELKNTAIAQPALFVVEYCLARLLLSWGIEPAAMLGHSIGEYVAATLAGVMSLPDALMLVVHRGRLMQGLPTGSMLSVALAEEALQQRLEEFPSLDIAAVNSQSNCVISGPLADVETLRVVLKESGIASTLLHTSHAFHSAMMEPILAPFTELLRNIRLSPPTRPFLSNVTGSWITQEQACSPAYWALHLRQPVRFAAMIGLLEDEGFTHFVEVGPGQVLTSLSRQILSTATVMPLLSSVRAQQSNVSYLMETIGRLWSVGFHVDWRSVYHHEVRCKVALPLYAFDRQRYSLSKAVAPCALTTTQQSVMQPDVSQRQHHVRNDYVEPENELEWILAEMWQALLQISPVGRNDDFFELGGNSLIGIQLLERIRATFMVEVSVNDLFAAPTVSNLAAQMLDKLSTLTEEEANEVQKTLAAWLDRADK
ncbi:type I polyketide synthase [Dickeya dadantii]|uniref:type I polyketide synthase n=1 Tax=Dickeya dadantii TaxID=204038 RepID=UPI0003A589B7|nr:type I polyketide synthase [Dickeya dadantii]